MDRGRSEPLIPAHHDPRFAGVFLWYARRLLSRKFQRVHTEHATLSIAASAASHDGPVVMVLNHSSWWDPIVALVVGDTLLRGRSGIAPIDADQLARFRFFRKLGLFGIHPENPASMAAMLEYCAAWSASAPRPTIAITPQGRFCDVREPVRIRPGAAALASKLAPSCRVLAMTIEYAFWQSQRPEVFLRFAEAPRPRSVSTAAWQRSIESTMQRSAEELARLVIARDPSPLSPLLAQSGSSINPVYDLWLRIRGRTGEIASRRAAERSQRQDSQRQDRSASPAHAHRPAGAAGGNA